ncbi:hypothetical protein D9615_006894 [Tricholomella constricta]|uniref:Uncharacterized protein n=1 Tax=Tricholomella constricta TaxID=117010 RepID=A0A8H5H8U8_9AGAR|nr:hypothetical protein D9615_006894 [Tricholomella constricta]
MAAVEVGYPDAERLVGIVYNEELAVPSCSYILAETEKLLKFKSTNTSHQKWMKFLRMKSRPTGLPPVINSEADIRPWIQQVSVKPALAVIRAAFQREEIQIPEDIKARGPYTASSWGTQDMPIPDEILFSDVPTGDNFWGSQSTFAAALFEYKTMMAMKESDVKKLVSYAKTYAELMVLPFIWPSSKTDCKLDSRSKIIAQVYCQLWRSNVDFMVLSSYQLSLFLYLDRPSRILHISKPSFPGIPSNLS